MGEGSRRVSTEKEWEVQCYEYGGVSPKGTVGFRHSEGNDSVVNYDLL